MDSYGYYPVVSTSKSSSGPDRQRHFYDEIQLSLLDAEFARDSFPNREGRRRIAQLIGVSEKSIMWWFQNRRRRARQFGSSRSTPTRQTTRQHRRPSPYVSRQQDSYVSSQVLHPFQDPINYSTSDASPSSPPQTEWVAADVCLQSNYSEGFQPQQQEYSSYYWNNWEYSPPFYSTSMANLTLYSNTDRIYDYSSNYDSTEATNQFYYQSQM